MSSDSRTGTPVLEGVRLFQDWQTMQERLQSAKATLNRAECDARNAENALSSWLLPADATNGEKITMWFGNQLVQTVAAVKTGNGWEGPVSIRVARKVVP